MFKKVIMLISELKSKNLYILEMLIRFVIVPSMIIIFGLVLLKDINSIFGRILVFSFLIFIVALRYIFVYMINVSMEYILYDRMDLDKSVQLIKYFSKEGTLANISALSLLDYYHGSFEASVTKLIKNIKLILRSKQQGYKFSSFASLYKSGIMTGNEKLIEKSRSELERLHFKNAKKEKWRVNELAFCDMMYDIVILKEVNDAINTWMPQYPGGKINILERTYFQALNEQLKGNADQAREYFEQLSKENEDLYFVKEAKKELEGFGLNT